MSLDSTFIAVDWGSTNCRAYLIEGGGVTASVEGLNGVLRTPDFPAAIASIRERLGQAPMLLAGMVGSNRGWVEVPYVPSPAGLHELARAVHRVAPDIGIVPGVRTDRDIMRGEEVQAIGAAAAGRVTADARICHPGTHAKWIEMTSGRIVDFRTAMTGELFALVKSHSILAPDLGGQIEVGSAFLAGVDVALGEEPLLDALFGVRSRLILGHLDQGEAASFTSGLVIGFDAVAHASPGGQVELLGDVRLCTLYAAALQHVGCATGSTDGSKAFVAGMIAIREAQG
jgi:2-dehydro-3-deoxygalactonokinase